jgi:hypothetical protein
MNNERDPVLEAIFSLPESKPANDSFTNEVMNRVEARRRRVLLGRVAIVVALFALEFLLSAPLNESLEAVAGALGTNLIRMNESWFATLIAPLNSVAGLLGMLLLGLQFVYRRSVR